MLPIFKKMAGVDYCTVLPSWEFDRDPACVVEYLFDSIDGSNESDDPSEQERDIALNTNHCLLLERTNVEEMGENGRDACSLSITCKPQYRVSVLGLDIMSESSSVEIYDAGEGYVTTVRGRRVPCMDEEGGEDNSNIYRCRVRLKDTVYGFSVKFPCTVNMQKFNIHQILLVLNPESEEPECAFDDGSLNLDKVKSFIDTDNLPTGAQELMRTMEQYQQNKRSGLTGIQSLMSGLTLGPPSQPTGGLRPPGGAGAAGLMGLMTMFSSLPNSQNVSQNASNESRPLHESDAPSQTSTCVLLDNEGLPVIGGGNTTDRDGDYEREGDSGMLRMLQGICGQVSQMRRAEQRETTGGDSPIEVNDITCQEEHETEPPENKNIDNQLIETVVNKCLQEVEDRLTSHIDTKIAAMEERINDKLDKIFLALKPQQSDGDSGEVL